MRVDAAGTLKSAAYSQHGRGEKCGSADVPLTAGGHPIDWPGIGSHANYFWAGDHAIRSSWAKRNRYDRARGSDVQDRSTPHRRLHAAPLDPLAWLVGCFGFGASTAQGHRVGSRHGTRSPGTRRRAVHDQTLRRRRGPRQNAGCCESSTNRRSTAAEVHRSTRGQHVIVKYCFTTLPARSASQALADQCRRRQQARQPAVAHARLHDQAPVWNGPASRRRHQAAVLALLSVTSYRGERSRIVTIRLH